jgi:hypothetical protein
VAVVLSFAIGRMVLIVATVCSREKEREAKRAAVLEDVSLEVKKLPVDANYEYALERRS